MPRIAFDFCLSGLFPRLYCVLGHLPICLPKKLVPWGTDGQLPLSDLDLDFGSGHTAYRRASLIDLYLHIKFHWDGKKNFFEGHHWGFGQVQSHVTQKLGQISKIQSDQILILCSSLRISGHLPAAIVNGGGDRFWKWKEFKLSTSRDLDLDLGYGRTAYRRASLIDLYLHTKFHWDRKKFFFEGHHWGFGQVQSHVTQKLGQISKIRPDQI